MTDDPVSLHSTKGQQRAARIRERADYLENYATGYVAKAETSAHRWVLARLEHIEGQQRERSITQAQAVEIIRAWMDAGSTTVGGTPILAGFDLERLGIR